MNTCTLCQQLFEIYDADRDFYKKFDIPDPELCPDCRSQRRLAHRNETSLHAGSCGLCKKQIISQYSPDKTDLTVYCRECWWSDKWDPYQYAREYDFTRSFFAQFAEFIRTVPHINLLDMKSENSDYTHCVSNNKASYLIFTSDYNQNCLYSNWLQDSRDCVDCYKQTNSEQAYESYFGERIYNGQYLVKCFSATESMFCYDCRNVQNCVLSYNLRNKQYCILNQQYTKEEYEAKLKELQLDTYAGRQKALQQLKDIIHNEAINHFRNQMGRIENSTGDDLRNVENCFECYGVEDATNCRYVRSMVQMKDSMDCTYGGRGEEGYQNVETYPMPRHAMCTYGSYGGNDVYYSHSVMNSKFVFGSAGLKKGEHVIFNKKYSAEEYEALFAKIKQHMLSTGEWGQFFPIENSLFAYNETNAQHWHALPKDAVLQQGWKWRDDEGVAPANATPAVELPETIAEVTDDILTQSIACSECGKAYKIVKAELEYYRAHNIPLPRKCYNCRYEDRRNWKYNHFHIAEQQCTCTDPAHEEHTTNENGRCATKVMTSLEPEKTTRIYCNECYQHTIY